MNLLLYGLAIFAVAIALSCTQSSDQVNDPPADTVTQLIGCAAKASASPRRAAVCVVGVIVAALLPRRCICEAIDSLITAIKGWLHRVFWPVINNMIADLK